MYDFGRQWSYEEYASKSRTLRDIRRDMHKQREWRNELERMKVSNVVGCLYVDSKSLRNDLMPITTTTLDKIKLLLLNMARETCLSVGARAMGAGLLRLQPRGWLKSATNRVWGVGASHCL